MLNKKLNRPVASPQTEQVRQNLRHSIRDGVAYSAMVGLGESYLAAFILALGFSQLSSALISTLPLLAGALLQLLSPRGLIFLGSHRRWVVSSACLQASTYFLFVLAAITRSFPEWAIYVCASLYWAASMATGPAWNTWINALVPKKLRVDFFSQRTRWTHGATMFGLILGGLALNWGRQNSMEMTIFIYLFCLSAGLRFLSAFSLGCQTEPKSLVAEIRPVSFTLTFRKVLASSYGKILIYLFFLQIAVHTAAGFFNPFMLSQLRLPYASYMLLMGCVLLGKALAMPLISRCIKRWGLNRVLIIASFGISPLPICWLFHDSLLYLVLLQLSAGILWAAHELAVFLILFGEIPREDRTAVLTEFNFFQTVGMVIGAVIGGIVFNNTGQNLLAYTWIFGLSTLARFLCLLAIPNVQEPVRLAGLRIYQRAIRPGGIPRPVITDVQER